jgi:hypothetical protein
MKDKLYPTPQSMFERLVDNNMEYNMSWKERRIMKRVMFCGTIMSKIRFVELEFRFVASLPASTSGEPSPPFHPQNTSHSSKPSTFVRCQLAKDVLPHLQQQDLQYRAKRQYHINGYQMKQLK